ncbi:hypothetical protein Tdes44962_MAKER07374 [Teratosphaeria destructans]|uniref:Uncharacterized protein n=1 Tax=Teratosphaeria destructans TaxID=418781 RepID=A0A9W7SZL3_9PEZI|nr:hypothetical protein Tdes44962_MAKER07374 [Teratosphaeria destructans]
MWLLIPRLRLKRDGEVVPQSVHDDDHSLVEALGMPTTSVWRAGNIRRRVPSAADGLDGEKGAFGSIGEDETREEEAGAEEVDAQRVEQTGRASVCGWDEEVDDDVAYKIKRKKATTSPCCAWN